MGQFEESIRNHFFKRGSSEAKKGTRVCLLDVSGNAVGSKDIENVANYVLTKDCCVDLGLPSGRLWAKCNLGATKPSDYGWYAAWGETMAYENVDARNAILDRSDGFTQNAYQAGNIAADLTLEQDVAHLLLGCNWHMPSKEDFQELYDNCTTAWTSNYNNTGVAGYLFTATNGNTLFFPAAGVYNGTVLSNYSTYGDYWSSSYSSSTKAYYFVFNSSSVNPQSTSSPRYYGLSIRPVQ